MIAIYSRPWFDELDAALRASSDIPAELSLRLGYRIETDQKPIEYTIVVSEGTAGVEVALDSRADVVFAQTQQTALALATGQVTAHEAFMTGLLRVEGDPQKLVGVDTAWLDEAHASLRQRTDFSAEVG